MKVFQTDAAGVSDVMGGVLMVGITVTILAGLAFLLMSIDGPQEEDRPSLSLSADGGFFGWGTGDERLIVRHHGGEPLDRDGVTVYYTIDGLKIGLTGAQLDGDWADGELSIGESWTHTLLIESQNDVQMEIVQNTYDSHIVSAGRVRVGEVVDCSPDVASPKVSTWLQSPEDVEPDTVGAATIEVVVVDVCSGVDEAVDPHLEYRLDGGAWIDTGAMTDSGVQRWQGTIPDPTWSDHEGDTLEYRVTGMADELGNTGDSPVRSDGIGIVPT